MDQAKQFLTQFTGTEAYLFFYFLLAGCGIGFPCNSDLVIITACVMAATLGTFKFGILLPLAFFGLLTGDSINYFVARTYGKRILAKRPFNYILKPEKVSAAEIYLKEKGNRFLFLVRFLPLIRTVLYFTAGSLQVPPRTFFLLNGISTLLYLTMVMNAAYFAGENIDQVISFLKQCQFLLLGLVIAVSIFALLRKKMKRSVPS